MNRICSIVLLVGIPLALFSQTWMFVNKKNGTADSMLFSDVKSITIRSGSSSTQSDLVPVAGGTFLMGSTDAIDGASQHTR
jgi:hypothetical protein